MAERAGKASFSIARLSYVVHGVLGAIAGLFLAVVCVSGAVAAVASEIDELALYPAESTTFSWNEAMRAASAHPGVLKVAAIVAPTERVPVTRVSVLMNDDRMTWLHLDGDRVVDDQPEYDAHQIARDFHRELLAGPKGYYAVSSLGIVLLASVLTGLFV